MLHGEAWQVRAKPPIPPPGVIGLPQRIGASRSKRARETAQWIRAEEAATMFELQRAEALLDKHETVMGVAYLARIVRHWIVAHGDRSIV